MKKICTEQKKSDCDGLNIDVKAAQRKFIILWDSGKKTFSEQEIA